MSLISYNSALMASCARSRLLWVRRGGPSTLGNHTAGSHQVNPPGRQSTQTELELDKGLAHTLTLGFALAPQWTNSELCRFQLCSAPPGLTRLTLGSKSPPKAAHLSHLKPREKEQAPQP